ncbi:hypothetical protein WN55_04019 [Dufourea novaeangliae]|uniref:Uncharacterized protein n=1 Tax=Dufourea novaeangliae TaxID=178035 RepID=A0A154PKS6_DUFNO|nr:hypothetical protein WN55_04019 [Dufourea novaeangliae]
MECDDSAAVSRECGLGGTTTDVAGEGGGWGSGMRGLVKRSRANACSALRASVTSCTSESHFDYLLLNVHLYTLSLYSWIRYTHKA